jgi:hypothetical protein
VTAAEEEITAPVVRLMRQLIAVVNAEAENTTPPSVKVPAFIQQETV